MRSEERCAIGESRLAPKVDPKVLEREYVTTDASIRELARRYGMSWSAIATRARKTDAAGLTWHDKKQAFQQSVSEKSFDKTAERFAAEDASIREELILVHRATIHAYAAQLREGKIAVTPKDAVGATSALLLMLGEATSRTETTTIDVTSKLKPDELRQLAEFARARIVEGSVAEPAEPESSGTLKN